MLRRLAFLILAVVALAALSRVALAQEIRPLLDSDRFAVAAGGGYDFSPAPVKSEGSAGLFAGYPVTLHLAAHGEAVYGFDSGMRAELSGHYRTDLPGLSISLGYEFGNAAQWRTGIVYGHPLSPRLLIGGSVTWGLTSQTSRTSIGVRVPLLAGKNS